jgi:hypothetical protein
MGDHRGWQQEMTAYSSLSFDPTETRVKATIPGRWETSGRKACADKSDQSQTQTADHPNHREHPPSASSSASTTVAYSAATVGLTFSITFSVIVSHCDVIPLPSNAAAARGPPATWVRPRSGPRSSVCKGRRRSSIPREFPSLRSRCLPGRR